MSEKGRLEYEQGGWWIPSVYGADLEGFVCVWLCPAASYWPRYRWVEGGAVVYLPRCER